MSKASKIFAVVCGIVVLMVVPSVMEGQNEGENGRLAQL